MKLIQQNKSMSAATGVGYVTKDIILKIKGWVRN
jgi:hypothetical protein